MNAVMISVVGREAMREDTRQSLHERGVDVRRTFILDTLPPGIYNCEVNARQALKWAYGHPWDDVLFVEDDIRLSALWTVHEQSVRQANEFATTLYNPNYRFYPARLTSALRRGEPLAFEVANARDVGRFFGSQAILLRREAIATILDGWNRCPFDVRLREVCARHRGRLKIVVPNLVQHIGAAVKSTWSPYGKSHLSLSYQP